MITPPRIVKKYYLLIKSVNLWKSLRFNCKIFPWRVALKLPILLGYNTLIYRVQKGYIRLRHRPYFGMIKIGVNSDCNKPTAKAVTQIRFVGSGVMELGREIEFTKGSSIEICHGGCLKIGNYFGMNMHGHIRCEKSIIIGNYVVISWNVQIFDSNNHYTANLTTGEVKAITKPVFIPDGCWIANNVTLLGAKLPPYAVVASNSLVNKDFSNYSWKGALLKGIPATISDAGNVLVRLPDIEYRLRAYFQRNPEAESVKLCDIGVIEPADRENMPDRIISLIFPTLNNLSNDAAEQ